MLGLAEDCTQTNYIDLSKYNHYYNLTLYKFSFSLLLEVLVKELKLTQCVVIEIN